MTKALDQWMGRKSLLPFQEFSEIQDSFDRLFNEVMSLKRMNKVQDFGFSPSCEISEAGNNLILKLDVPGVSKEDVKVEVDKERLTVSAERKEEKRSDSDKKHLSEINYGFYTRSFALPGPVDEKKIDAKFENGVLTVTIPKTETVKAKQVHIQ